REVPDRGDPRSLHGPLPSHHDDDDGRAGRHIADPPGIRRRRRSAAAAGPGGGGGIARLAAADAVHHTGLLRLYRAGAFVADGAASGTKHRATIPGMIRPFQTIVATVLVAVATLAHAQPRTAFPDKRGFKLTEFPRIVKLAENVYGYEEIRQPG